MNDSDQHHFHRELDTEAESPAIAVAMAVVDIEDTEATDLPSMYDCVDGIFDELFSTPPAAEAVMEISFNDANYRITVEQDGTAEFVKTEAR